MPPRTQSKLLSDPPRSRGGHSALAGWPGRLLNGAMALALWLPAAAEVPSPIVVHHAIGDLHGFPSMSDPSGQVVASGELTQELAAGRLAVTTRWAFADGRRVEERDTFRVGRDLVQEQFTWIERREGQELRRFEVDFQTGQALAVTRDGQARVQREEVRLDLPAGRSFAGYGVALVASEASLQEGAHTEVTFVAFTPRPRAVALEIRRGGQEPILVAGRAVPCDAYTLHPRIPFPLSLFAGARDAHLWLTHTIPSALVRARQSLVEKDDPVVIIDAMPRGPPAPTAARP